MMNCQSARSYGPHDDQPSVSTHRNIRSVATDRTADNRSARIVRTRTILGICSIVCMAVNCAMTVCAMVCVTAPCLAGENARKQPQLRYVAVAESHVYAGPSEDYYPTSTLKRGEVVEVYSETADGWLAIRPPQGSFSWIPAAQALLLPGGRVIEVTDKSAVSWIGSALGTAKQYRWQVRLNRGEQLTVLGEQTITDEATSKQTLWYKVSPPNGEYRWMRAQATSTDKPATESIAKANGEGADSDATLSEQSSDASDGSVVTASAEEQLVESSPSRTSSNGSRSIRGNRNPSMQHKHVDRWANWHAVEFKNGSFRFPGITRMFGGELPPSDPRGPVYDPFDLNNNAASRVSSVRPGYVSTEEEPSISEQTMNNSLSMSSDRTRGTLASGRSRGWRDPRQLRESRRNADDGTGIDTDGQLVDGGMAASILEGRTQKALSMHRPAMQ